MTCVLSQTLADVGDVDPRHISVRIRSSSSVDELHAAVFGALNSLNAIHVSSAMHKLSKLSSDDDDDRGK